MVVCARTRILLSLTTIPVFPKILLITLFLFVPRTSDLVQRHVLWFYRSYQNLGQVNHNFYNHVFDDVRCKPPIQLLRNQCRLLMSTNAISANPDTIFSTFWGTTLQALKKFSCHCVAPKKFFGSTSQFDFRPPPPQMKKSQTEPWISNAYRQIKISKLFFPHICHLSWTLVSSQCFIWSVVCGRCSIWSVVNDEFLVWLVVGGFYGRCAWWSVFCIFTVWRLVFIFENGQWLCHNQYMVGGWWLMVGGLWSMAGRGQWFCTTPLFYAAIKSCCGCGSEEVVHPQHR